MNITPLNNSNNKNNINFKRIYRIEISQSYPNAEKLKSSLYGYFDLQSKLRGGLNSKPQGIGEQIKAFFHDIVDFSVNRETNYFKAFQYLKKNTDREPFWLKGHLNIDEPKPLREGYDTFFVHTADDCTKLNKINTRTILKEVLEDVRNKCSNGEIKDYDKQYWTKLLFAQKLDDAIKETFANRSIKKIVINNDKDVRAFTDYLCDARTL